MELTELSNLIAIRQYVVNATGNASIDRATVKYMNNLLIMIDKKIISLLQNEDFQKYVDYKDVKRAVEDVMRITNIKSGLKQ
jgi:hypothetical protein